jgi:hypothetical protein
MGAESVVFHWTPTTTTNNNNNTPLFKDALDSHGTGPGNV